MYSRMKEHEDEDDFVNEVDVTPLFRHSQLYHGGNQFQYEVSVIGKCFGKASRRLITEAVMIDELGDDEVMNAKREWSYYALNKV